MEGGQGRTYAPDWVVGFVTRKLHGCFIINHDVFAHKSTHEGGADCRLWFDALRVGDAVEFLAYELVCGRNNWRASRVRDPSLVLFRQPEYVPVPYGIFHSNPCLNTPHPIPQVHFNQPPQFGAPPPFGTPMPMPMPRQWFPPHNVPHMPHPQGVFFGPCAAHFGSPTFVIVSEPTIVSPSVPEAPAHPLPRPSLRPPSPASSLENDSEHSDLASVGSATTSFGSPQVPCIPPLGSPELVQLSVRSRRLHEQIAERFLEPLAVLFASGDVGALDAVLSKEASRNANNNSNEGWKSQFIATALLKGLERVPSSKPQSPGGGAHNPGREAIVPDVCALLQCAFLRLHARGVLEAKDFRAAFLRVVSVLDELAKDTNPQAHQHASAMLAHAIHFGYLEFDSLRQVLLPLKLSGKALMVALLTLRRMLAYCDVATLHRRFTQSTFELGDVVGDLSDKEVRAIVDDMGLRFLMRDHVP